VLLRPGRHRGGDGAAADVDHVGPKRRPPWRGLFHLGDLACRRGETADDSKTHHERR